MAGGEQASPTPAGTPDKPLTGDVKGAGEEKPKGDQEAAPAEVERRGRRDGRNSGNASQSMKDEEQKVQLDEHKSGVLSKDGSGKGLMVESG
jgi:hypothetical protein